MQIRFSQLGDHLNKSPVSVMLVSGDEPYQCMLAADMYRTHIQEMGYLDRKILTVETRFDWSELELAKSNLSLFDDRILIDLRILSGKPGKNGSKAIVNFVNDIHQDVKLLIQVPKLDRSSMNSAWVKAIDKAGVIIRIWPLSESETKNWIKRKLESKGYSTTHEIVSIITQHVEGNLLAAMQEIEKIALICETKKLDVQEINYALTNSSHYSLNELMDAVTSRNMPRLARILHSLEKEDIAPPLLLWGLTEQIRKIVESKSALNSSKEDRNNNSLIHICNIHQQHIGVKARVSDFSTSDLLKQCAWTDRVIKGRAKGNPWHELLQLSIAAQLAA